MSFQTYTLHLFLIPWSRARLCCWMTVWFPLSWQDLIWRLPADRYRHIRAKCAATCSYWKCILRGERTIEKLSPNFLDPGRGLKEAEPHSQLPWKRSRVSSIFSGTKIPPDNNGIREEATKQTTQKASDSTPVGSPVLLKQNKLSRWVQNYFSNWQTVLGRSNYRPPTRFNTFCEKC